MSFSDDYPGGESKMRPVDELYKVVEKQFAKAQSEFFADLAKKLGVTEQQYHAAAAQQGILGSPISYDKTRKPVDFDGAQEIALKYINGVDNHDSGERGFAQVGFSLFIDGSPFLFEDDVDEVSEIGGGDNGYILYVSPEHPPFVAASTIVNENVTIDRTGKVATSQAYLMYAEAEGKKVHFLNDAEAQILIEALQGAEIDVDETIIWREPDLDEIAMSLHDISREQPDQE